MYMLALHSSDAHVHASTTFMPAAVSVMKYTLGNLLGLLPIRLKDDDPQAGSFVQLLS